MGYGLGVDLGTTHTAAAVEAGGRVEAVRLGGHRPEIPSLIFLRADGEVLVGEAAQRRGEAEPTRLAREFKRRLGDPVPVLLGGAPFSAHALTARLLKHVVETVERVRDGRPERIVVTHPANWGPYKRELLQQAAGLADLPEVTLSPEPSAAAVRFAGTERIAVGETLAVYDLGGGTFDAAVLRKSAEGFTLLGEPSGIEQLGGIDFDEAILDRVRLSLGDAFGDPDPDDNELAEALLRLRRDCVEAKESLSYDTETVIPVALPHLHTRVRMTRAEFEAMIEPSIDDTVDAVRRALRTAGLRPDELRCIVLAGGSARIPLISGKLSTAFDRPVLLDDHPELGIAMGAAVLTRPQSATPAFSPPSSFTAQIPAVTDAAPPNRAPAGWGRAGSASTGPAPAGSTPAGSTPAGLGAAGSHPVGWMSESSTPVSPAGPPTGGYPENPTSRSFGGPADPGPRSVPGRSAPGSPPSAGAPGPVSSAAGAMATPVSPEVARARRAGVVGRAPAPGSPVHRPPATEPPPGTGYPADPSASAGGHQRGPAPGHPVDLSASTGGHPAGHQRAPAPGRPADLSASTRGHPAGPQRGPAPARPVAGDPAATTRGLRPYRWVLIGGVAVALVAAGVVAAWPRGTDTPAAVQPSPVAAPTPAATEVWKAPTGHPATAPPAVTADRVFVGGADGVIRAFDRADGTPAWSWRTGDEKVTVAADVIDDTVYASTAGGSILAVDAGTGKPLWRQWTGTRFAAQPLVADGRIYAGGRDAVLYSYQLTGYHSRWRVWTGAEIRSAPVAGGGAVSVASRDTRLYTIADGRILTSPVVGQVAGRPAVTGDTVCVALEGGSLRCLARGRQLSRIALPGEVLSAPVAAGGLVYAAAEDRSIAAWDVRTGALRWHYQPPATPPAAGLPAVGEGGLTVSYPDGQLIGLDPATGAVRWQTKLPEQLATAPATTSDRAFVVGKTGVVYAFRTPAAAQLPAVQEATTLPPATHTTRPSRRTTTSPTYRSTPPSTSPPATTTPPTTTPTGGPTTPAGDGG